MITWKPLLARWSKQLMKSSLRDRVQLPPASPNWLGFAPATKADIEALEQRLGLKLPPSYKSFLLKTNGWGRTTPFVNRIRPVGEVDWYKTENQQAVEVYSQNDSDLPDEKYFDYGQHAELHHRADHVQHLVQISDVEDGVYLLNPQAVTPDGEWEAWFLAGWVPGPRRHPSFAHLMADEYKSFVELQNIPMAPDDLPVLEMPSPQIKRVAAKRAKVKPPPPPAVEELIEQLRSSDDKQRARTVKIFFGQLKGRPFAVRRQDLVPKLTEIYNESKDPHVRAACVAALTEMAERFQPPPLFAALSDPDPGVVLQGMHALTYFRDKRAIEPLCRFAQSGLPGFALAIDKLGDFGDARAVPTLTKLLFEMPAKSEQILPSIGVALGRCGMAGFDALISVVDHADSRIRFAAACGLDTSGDSRAGPYLDQLEKDADEKVQKRAKHRVGKPNW